MYLYTLIEGNGHKSSDILFENVRKVKKKHAICGNTYTQNIKKIFHGLRNLSTFCW